MTRNEQGEYKKVLFRNMHEGLLTENSTNSVTSTKGLKKEWLSALNVFLLGQLGIHR